MCIMTYRGIARGRTIELESRLPYPEGQAVEVSVQIEPCQAPVQSPAVIRQAMHAPPLPDNGAVAELERIIAEGRLDVRDGHVFEAGQCE
jgi:hypothetical protein